MDTNQKNFENMKKVKEDIEQAAAKLNSSIEVLNGSIALDGLGFKNNEITNILSKMGGQLYNLNYCIIPDLESKQ